MSSVYINGCSALPIIESNSEVPSPRMSVTRRYHRTLKCNENIRIYLDTALTSRRYVWLLTSNRSIGLRFSSPLSCLSLVHVTRALFIFGECIFSFNVTALLKNLPIFYIFLCQYEPMFPSMKGELAIVWRGCYVFFVAKLCTLYDLNIVLRKSFVI